MKVINTDGSDNIDALKVGSIISALTRAVAQQLSRACGSSADSSVVVAR